MTQKIEALCKILSDKARFEIAPIFLDFSLDLDGIVDEIDDFRAYEDSKKIYRAAYADPIQTPSRLILGHSAEVDSYS